MKYLVELRKSMFITVDAEDFQELVEKLRREYPGWELQSVECKEGSNAIQT